MPLIMITGYPCSGKTTRAKQLKDSLEARIQQEIKPNYSVVLIDDDALGISKEQYRGAQTEKAARGMQMAAVKKHLSRTSIVILDNMSYIKGFRYQLFCEAKSLSTNSCVIHVGAPKEICSEWNSKREQTTEKWPQDLFDALVFRYEEPNGMTKWDSPLFVISQEDTQLPIDEIWDQVILKKPKPPNQATSIKPVTPSNYLTELDKITMQTTNELLSLHSTNPGGRVKVSGYEDPVDLPLRMSLPEMNRHRRTFIALNKMKPIEVPHIKPRYIDYLLSTFDN